MGEVEHMGITNQRGMEREPKRVAMRFFRLSRLHHPAKVNQRGIGITTTVETGISRGLLEVWKEGTQSGRVPDGGNGGWKSKALLLAPSQTPALFL